MFCPKCGSQHVVEGETHPNGGYLYVAEDCDSSTEFYDEAIPYVCSDCNTQFYLGAE